MHSSFTVNFAIIGKHRSFAYSQESVTSKYSSDMMHCNLALYVLSVLTTSVQGNRWE